MASFLRSIPHFFVSQECSLGLVTFESLPWCSWCDGCGGWHEFRMRCEVIQYGLRRVDRWIRELLWVLTVFYLHTSKSVWKYLYDNFYLRYVCESFKSGDYFNWIAFRNIVYAPFIVTHRVEAIKFCIKILFPQHIIIRLFNCIIFSSINFKFLWPLGEK